LCASRERTFRQKETIPIAWVNMTVTDFRGLMRTGAVSLRMYYGKEIANPIGKSVRSVKMSKMSTESNLEGVLLFFLLILSVVSSSSSSF
jgi:hypothetical protein